jgi:hypothetical protein
MVLHPVRSSSPNPYLARPSTPDLGPHPGMAFNPGSPSNDLNRELGRPYIPQNDWPHPDEQGDHLKCESELLENRRKSFVTSVLKKEPRIKRATNRAANFFAKKEADEMADKKDGGRKDESKDKDKNKTKN